MSKNDNPPFAYVSLVGVEQVVELPDIFSIA